MKTFGKTIKAARLAKHLSQLELAELCGIKKEYLVNLENDTYGRSPSMKILIKLAKYLDINSKEIGASAGRDSITAQQYAKKIYDRDPRFCDLLRKMYHDPNFANAVIKDAIALRLKKRGNNEK